MTSGLLWSSSWGSGAGLSATTITRLTSQWQDEAKTFTARDLSGTDYVYLWVDGIHLKVRLEQDKLCLLVMLGVRADGRKELVALTDGYRECTESWADLLRDCRRRGMIAPVLAVGDGALGFWKAVREVFPATREQRCWFHKQANVLAALPKSAHPGALAALKDIYNAEDIAKAQLAIKAFEVDYAAKYPKAVAKIVDDADVLLEFYKYPAEHWIHLRTTNPIESTFATVRLRTKVTKGPGSRAAGIAMAYKLIDAAQARWRAVNARIWWLSSVPAPFSTKANSSNAPSASHRPNLVTNRPERRSPETRLSERHVVTIVCSNVDRTPITVGIARPHTNMTGGQAGWSSTATANDRATRPGWATIEAAPVASTPSISSCNCSAARRGEGCPRSASSFSIIACTRRRYADVSWWMG